MPRPVKSLLVVTGSRDLSRSRGGSAESMAWVYDRLGEAILSTRPDLLIAGDAEPVDKGAFRIADDAKPQIAWRCFALDGVLYHGRYGIRRWRELPGPCTNPLARNLAMVVAAKKCLDAGWNVRGIALKAPWSRTDGTGHTARHAEAAGINVKILACPAEYAGNKEAARG